MRVADVLLGRPYPGRGLLVARTAAEGLCALYWLTGRGSASRDRRLVDDGVGLAVVPRSPTPHDPLRHYRAGRRTSTHEIVGNGDHVDQLAELLDDGLGAHEALGCLRPEPDALRTARLAAVVDLTRGGVVLGAARALAGGGVDHLAVAAESVPAGWGCLLTTYEGDPEHPEVFAMPVWVEVAETLHLEAEALWDVLDARYRVAVAGRALASRDPWNCRP